MTCPHCAQPAEVHLVPDPRALDGIGELARCYTCCRERVTLRDGAVKWLLMGTHCRRCGAALWRTIRHGRYGQVVYLWPDPTHVTAMHYVFGADEHDGVKQPYCAGCAPAVGEAAPHQAEMSGEPIEIGPVVGHLDSRTRYARDYTPRYRRFLEAHLRDEYGQEGAQIAATLAQWDADVAGLA